MRIIIIPFYCSSNYVKCEIISENSKTVLSADGADDFAMKIFKRVMKKDQHTGENTQLIDISIDYFGARRGTADAIINSFNSLGINYTEISPIRIDLWLPNLYEINNDSYTEE